MKPALLFAACLALMLIGVLLNGWVLSLLWGWFLVPTLGLPSLSILQSIGIALAISYLTYQYIDTQPKDFTFVEKFGEILVVTIVRPFFAVTFGFIVHLMM
jgi:hypothetical protein